MVMFYSYVSHYQKVHHPNTFGSLIHGWTQAPSVRDLMRTVMTIMTIRVVEVSDIETTNIHQPINPYRSENTPLKHWFCKETKII